MLSTLMFLSAISPLGSNACADAGRTGSSDTEGLLTVQRIEVNVVRSVPSGVFVRVHGVVLNGCTVLGTVAQHRTGHTITVTIPTHAQHHICTMMARLIDETIRLNGDFTSGSYTVNVNGVVAQFKV